MRSPASGPRPELIERTPDARARSCEQEIGEWNHDAAGLLLGVQLAGQLGDVRRQGIDDDGRQEILDERFATRSPFGRVRAVNAVNEFNDTDRGEGDRLIAGRIVDALEKGLHAVAAALGRDRDTRIEDQSHAGGVSGSRWLLTAASRSRPNSSSSVAFELRSLARRSDSQSSRTFGPAGRSTATASAFRSITTSAPARTRAKSDGKSFAASASDTRIVGLLISSRTAPRDGPVFGKDCRILGSAHDMPSRARRGMIRLDADRPGASMIAQEELRTIEGGSVLIVRVVAGQGTQPDGLIAERLQRYMYAPKPYVASVIDISLGGYFISSFDLTAMVMSLPPESSGRTACAVVATEKSAARLQQLLDITKMGSFIRVFTSLDEALNAVSIGVANRGPGLPALFIQSSRAADNSPAASVPIVGSDKMAELHATTAPSGLDVARPKVFLAHASEDKEAVRILHRKLTDRGFQPWLDEIDLIPGQNWPVAISEAIRRSDVFLACLSQWSVSKHGYVQRELRTALAAYGERPPGTIYLIPVKLDECDVPDLQMPELGIRLRDFQWLDLWKTDGFDGLVNAISVATAIQNPQSREPANRGVRIVDISFVERIPEQERKWPGYLEETGYVRLDIKIRSTSSEVAFIKRLTVSIEQMWALEGFAFTGAAVPVSANYDMALPIKPPPFRVDMPIAHSLEPTGVDRFVVTIQPERSGHLFVARLELLYDEDDKSAASGRVLFATRSGARTWPTASPEVLAETDRIAAGAAPGTMWDRWPLARQKIESNNRIRDAIAHVPGTRNRAVDSFENGEPLIDGF